MYLRCNESLRSEEYHVNAVFKRIPGNKGIALWTDPLITPEEIKMLVYLFDWIRKSLFSEGVAGIKEVRVCKGMENLSRLSQDGKVVELAHGLLPYPRLVAHFVLPHEMRRRRLRLPPGPLFEFIMVLYDCLQFDRVASENNDKFDARRIILELGKVESAADNGPNMQRMLGQLEEKIRHHQPMISPSEFVDAAKEYAQNEPFLKCLTSTLFERKCDNEFFVNCLSNTMHDVTFDELPDAPCRDAFLIFDDATLGEDGSTLSRGLIFNSIQVQRCEILHAGGDAGFAGSLGTIDPSQRTITIHVPTQGMVNVGDPDQYFAATMALRTLYLIRQEPQLLNKLYERMRMDASVISAIENHLRCVSRTFVPASSTPVPPWMVSMRKLAGMTVDLLCRINHIQCLAQTLNVYEAVRCDLIRNGAEVPKLMTSRIDHLLGDAHFPPVPETLKFAKEAEDYLVNSYPELRAVFQYPFFSTLRILPPMKCSFVKETPHPETRVSVEGKSAERPHSRAQTFPRPSQLQFNASSSDPLVREIYRIATPEFPKPGMVTMWPMQGNSFNAMLKQLKDRPKGKYVEWGDPRGLADPKECKIFVNMDHPFHLDEQGGPDVVGLLRTLVRLKTHMIYFLNQERIREYVASFLGYEYLEEQVIKYFYAFYFDRLLDIVNEEVWYRMFSDPLWQGDREDRGGLHQGVSGTTIAMDRLVSMVCASINEYLILPPFRVRAEEMQRQLIEQDAEVPETMKTTIKRLSDTVSGETAQVKRAREALKKVELLHTSRLHNSGIVDLLIVDMTSLYQSIQMRPMDQLPLL